MAVLADNKAKSITVEFPDIKAKVAKAAKGYILTTFAGGSRNSHTQPAMSRTVIHPDDINHKTIWIKAFQGVLVLVSPAI